jgi:cysteine desulfurase
MATIGRAAEEALSNRDMMSTEVARLKYKLEDGILTKVSRATVLFRDEQRVSHCTAIAFDGVYNELLAYILYQRGVYVGSGYEGLTNELLKSNVDVKIARSALTFSLSVATTDDDIDRAIDCIADAVTHARNIAGCL